MPRIEVRAAERTFSTEIGAWHWLPGSLLALRIYPALWEIWDLENQHPLWIGSCYISASAGWHFAVATDWRRGEISVRLHCKATLHQWLIAPNDLPKSLTVELQRTMEPVKVLWRTKDGSFENEWSLQRKEALLLEGGAMQRCDLARITNRDRTTRSIDQRIFFGCHKAAQWSRIDRRCDLTEIGPILNCAGQWARKVLLPMTKGQSVSAGLAAKSAGLDSGDRHLSESFERFWHTHFLRWALPHWGDAERTGLRPLWQEPLSPLYLYVFAADWLSSRLFKAEGDALTLLPSLPDVCHAGQVRGVPFSLGTCDFRWSKKALKEVIFKCSESGIASLFFQKKAHQVRLRRIDRRFGALYPLQLPGTFKFAVQRGRCYRIDCFSGNH